MIIKLRKYNEIRELLIENRTTGSQEHVSYWNGGWSVSVTRVAVHMGVEEMGVQTRDRVHTINLQVGNESRYVVMSRNSHVTLLTNLGQFRELSHWSHPHAKVP